VFHTHHRTGFEGQATEGDLNGNISISPALPTVCLPSVVAFSGTQTPFVMPLKETTDSKQNVDDPRED